MSLLTRDGFLNNCPMKPFVICHPISKFDMLTFFVSHTVCSIFFFCKLGALEFLIFGVKTENGAFSKEGRTKLEWNYGTIVKSS